MKPRTVHLGFEIPSGEPVEIPVAHLCVTGQTQLSGKTTTLEALVTRSGLKAIAFITKRGEGAFGADKVEHLRNALVYIEGRPSLQPFFRHRADWQFVSDILGAILSEKLKFQRPWIMKVCRGAKTLRDVQAAVKLQLSGDTKKKLRAATGLSESVYTELDEYFDLLIPEIERLPYTDKLELQPGLNVMVLSDYSTALQMLVISSVLDEVYKNHKGVITVIPEAWEFVPNNKNSPAKSAAITLARKGAALGNFNWYDSQDLASIDTEIRRSVSVWILGVQREQNEVKRMLSHIPNAPKPKVDDVMQLERGQFFLCHGREVKKVYVQPAWMAEDIARKIATGEEPAWGWEMGRAEIRESIKQLEGPVSIKVEHVNSKTGERAPMPSVRFDLDHPRDSISFVDPRRLPPVDFNSYNKAPKGVPYYMDPGDLPYSGVAYTEIDMDQQERDRYEQTITELRQEIAELRELRIPHPLAQRNGSLDPSAVNETESIIFGENIPESFYAEVARRVMALMPTNGVVKVEPLSYVLKEFQKADVERLLQFMQSATPWQKSVVRYLHSKGSNARYADLVRALKGKDQNQISGSQNKNQKDELKALVNAGVLRIDSSGRYYPELEKMVKDRLAQFSASDEEVSQVVGEAMLRLK